MEEAVETIEKATVAINKFSAKNDGNYNQVVRWINTKEIHATKIQDSVQSYFLAQRVKPEAEGDKAKYDVYTKKVILLHQIIVAAMKTKQTTDMQYTNQLKDLIKEFKTLYNS